MEKINLNTSLVLKDLKLFEDVINEVSQKALDNDQPEEVVAICESVSKKLRHSFFRFLVQNFELLSNKKLRACLSSKINALKVELYAKNGIKELKKALSDTLGTVEKKQTEVEALLAASETKRALFDRFLARGDFVDKEEFRKIVEMFLLDKSSRVFKESTTKLDNNDFSKTLAEGRTLVAKLRNSEVKQRMVTNLKKLEDLVLLQESVQEELLDFECKFYNLKRLAKYGKTDVSLDLESLQEETKFLGVGFEAPSENKSLSKTGDHTLNTDDTTEVDKILAKQKD